MTAEALVPIRKLNFRATQEGAQVDKTNEVWPEKGCNTVFEIGSEWENPTDSDAEGYLVRCSVCFNTWVAHTML